MLQSNEEPTGGTGGALFLQTCTVQEVIRGRTTTKYIIFWGQDAMKGSRIYFKILTVSDIKPECGLGIDILYSSGKLVIFNLGFNETTD